MLKFRMFLGQFGVIDNYRRVHRLLVYTVSCTVRFTGSFGTMCGQVELLSRQFVRLTNACRDKPSCWKTDEAKSRQGYILERCALSDLHC